ncbi:MAG: 4,5-DOPA dioxygenase extradiol [Psychromonas sp.]|jgi:4,5-DOPA dioxygenase extradiol|uniref:DODA-type extradiol aromatic ring-opening family dioxygenase n=1 Tax=Psychromonas sp. TaxID=1884585 RepID=UPI0039E372B4
MSQIKQPAFFISHGSPMMAVEKSKTVTFLQQLGLSFAKPKAIIVFSAHFDLARDIVITRGSAPKTIHDFYGFPQPLYDIQYNAPGSPELADKIADLFTQHGFSPVLDSQQGWDHGVWIPLRLIYPEADIPVIEVSINSRLGAAINYQYGQILAPLRNEGVMIIGSGSITHNLKEVFNPSLEVNKKERVKNFTAWVNAKLSIGDLNALLNYQNEAPDLLFNHPTAEHFLPLLAALGSSDLRSAKRIHEDIEYDVLAMDAYQFS